MQSEENYSLNFKLFFQNYHVVMLIVDPSDGKIVDANPAAAKFYGWSVEELKQMKVSDLNTLSPAEIYEAMRRVKSLEATKLSFKHRMQSGELRDVEVVSGPVNLGGRTLLYSIITDVTAHQEALRGLEKSEKKFRSVCENSSTPKIIVDSDLNVALVNKAACELFGCSSADIKSLKEFIFAEDLGLFAMAFRDLSGMSNITNSLFQARFVAAGGKHIWAESGIALISYPWEPCQYAIDLHDSTLEIETRLELDNMMSRFQSVVSVLEKGYRNVEDLLNVILEEAIKLSESKYGFIYRYDEEIGDYNMVVWSKDVHEDCGVRDADKYFSLSRVKLLADLLIQRRPIILNDFQAFRANSPCYPAGHVQIDKVMVLPLFRNGKMIAVVGIANKVTDYQQRDVWQLTLLLEVMFGYVEKLELENRAMRFRRMQKARVEVERILVKAVSIEEQIQEICALLVSSCGFWGAMIILLDSDKCPALTAQSGYGKHASSLADFLGKKMLPACFLQRTDSDTSLKYSEGEKTCVGCLVENLCHNHEIYCIPLAHKGLNLGYFSVSTSWFNRNMPEEEKLLDEIAYAIKISVHNQLLINETKIVLGEKDKLQELLIHSQRTEGIGQFTSGVIHDFNNMLSVICGYSEALSQDLPKESDWLRAVNEIQAAGLRAKELTSQLLRFSRKQITEFKVVSITNTVKGFEHILRWIMGAQISIDVSLPEETLNVMADVSQIEQVLMNLVSNARDALPNGGIISISASSEMFDLSQNSEGRQIKDCVVLKVSDNGVGIDQQTLRHIFEPFFTTKSPEKGTGLGLFTTEQIVKAHGGGIFVVSELGKGTSFKVVFPKTSNSKLDSPVVSSISQASSSATILLVEDEDPVRKIIYRILENKGFKVLEADCALNALELSRNFPEAIDLLLTDVVMPGIEGPELYQVLKNERPAMRVVFISGYVDSLKKAVSNTITPENFLQKPITVESLLTKIASALAVKDQE